LDWLNLQGGCSFLFEWFRFGTLLCGWSVGYSCKVIQLDSENPQGGCYFPFKWIRSGVYKVNDFIGSIAGRLSNWLG
jgi:hypothetical protein